MEGRIRAERTWRPRRAAALGGVALACAVVGGRPAAAQDARPFPALRPGASWRMQLSRRASGSAEVRRTTAEVRVVEETPGRHGARRVRLGWFDADGAPMALRVEMPMPVIVPSELSVDRHGIVVGGHRRAVLRPDFGRLRGHEAFQDSLRGEDSMGPPAAFALREGVGCVGWFHDSNEVTEWRLCFDATGAVREASIDEGEGNDLISLVASDAQAPPPPPPPAEDPLRSADIADLVVGHGVLYAWTRAGAAWRWRFDHALRFDPPARVPGLGRVAQVVLGDGFACARSADGAAACWGDGQPAIGRPAPAQPSAPTPVSGLGAVVQLSASGSTACARSVDGAVWCWGDPTFRTSGARVVAPVRIAGVSGATQVAVAPAHACAVVEGGAVTCWGQNRWGERGDASTRHRPRVAAVRGISGAVQLAVGAVQSCAGLHDGSVRCWGAGFGPAPSVMPDVSSGAVVLAGSTGTNENSAGSTYDVATGVGLVLADGGAIRAWVSRQSDLDQGHGERGDLAPFAAPAGATAISAWSVSQIDGFLGVACASSPSGVACWQLAPDAGPASAAPM